MSWNSDWLENKNVTLWPDRRRNQDSRTIIKLIGMTKLEKLYSIIENSKEVGVKLTQEVLQQVNQWTVL